MKSFKSFLKEAPIGSVKKGQMHADLGKSPNAKITGKDIAKEKAKGGVYAKRAVFAQNAKKWHHEEVVTDEELDAIYEGVEELDEFHSIPSYNDKNARHVVVRKSGEIDSAIELNRHARERAKEIGGKVYRKQPHHKVGDTYTAKATNESVEELDELSKSTLGSYVKKASVSAANHHHDSARMDQMAYSAIDRGDTTLEKNPVRRADNVKVSRERIDLARHHSDKAVKRLKGVEKATDRLTKEEFWLDEHHTDDGNNPHDPLCTVHSTTDKKIKIPGEGKSFTEREPMVGHYHLSTASKIHGVHHANALRDLKTTGEHVHHDANGGVRLSISRHQKIWENVEGDRGREKSPVMDADRTKNKGKSLSLSDRIKSKRSSK